MFIPSMQRQTMPDTQYTKQVQGPVGIGLYLRVMPPSTVKKRVKRMADNGVSFAAIATVWQDINRTTREPEDRVVNRPDVCKHIAGELMSRGITPLVWGYPMKGRHQQFADAIGESVTDSVAGVLLDPELRMKDRDKEVAAQAARDLLWACTQINPYLPILFTSYGFIRGHPTFPWAEFFPQDHKMPFGKVTVWSPQLYDQPAARILRGLREYCDAGATTIMPSFGTYRFAKDLNGKKTYPRMPYSQLKQHLERFEVHREEFNINSMIGWSEVQVTRGGWRAIAECAERFASTS